MLKLRDLAIQPDFQLGSIDVSPSRRLITGPAGEVHVAPLIMQVLLILLDARGSVVTRNELFDQCWGAATVGDDSLNRAVLQVRRVLEEVAPGQVEIETIPRTGYRLTCDFPAASAQNPADRPAALSGRFSRRALVGGGVAAVAAAGGFGLWSVRSQQSREFDELMVQGQEALDSSNPGANADQYFERAVAIRPDSAEAQGRFAFTRAMRADNAAPAEVGNALYEAERAARTALDRDPSEAYARLALHLIQRPTLDFAATEDQLREILATVPNDIVVMRHLWGLLQCVGRSRDALATIDRALAVKPLSAGNHYPKAQLLWILGRDAEADRMIDAAMQRWPSHWFVRFARFSIFAYTGRPRAALAMIGSKDTAPQNFSPEAISLWRISLAALDQRSPATIAAARKANLDAAKQNLQLANQAASVLSALGEIDAAFEIANALFVVPSSVEGTAQDRRLPARSTAWRFAPWLFTPPTKALRADPRFDALCDEIGLTEDWAKRRIKPDYQLGIT